MTHSENLLLFSSFDCNFNTNQPYITYLGPMLDQTDPITNFTQFSFLYIISKSSHDLKMLCNKSVGITSVTGSNTFKEYELC